MLSTIFAGVRERLRNFAIGQKFNAGVEGNADAHETWSKWSDALYTDADREQFEADMVTTALDDVVQTAKKFEFTRFEDDPQAAIKKAISVLGTQEDINGDEITVARVMEHLGLEYVEPEAVPDLQM